MISFFHHFSSSITGLPIPRQFTFPFAYVPAKLSEMAANEVKSYVSLHSEWHDELAKGKMFGVLVVKNDRNEIGYLAAFSGQLAGTATHSFFVPPVFDFLDPEGYFKCHENEISEINNEIDSIQQSNAYFSAKSHLQEITKQTEEEVERYKLMMSLAKNRRDEMRSNQILSADVEKQLIAESQFQKAELKRIKARVTEKVSSAKKELNQIENEINALKRKRESLSESLQNWLFQHFVFLNAQGEKADLLQIFQKSSRLVPPSGAGECCAPKLLQYAYTNGYIPISMAEFWWGQSPKAEIRRHGEYYPACKSKCEPILRFMLQGLNVENSPLLMRASKKVRISILYEDDYFIAVDKPTGILSVPGKLEADDLISLLLQQLPHQRFLLPVHRLDMDTSGVILIAKSMESFKALQYLFENRLVHKRYVAVLDGNLNQPAHKVSFMFHGESHSGGLIQLPLRPDLDDRPRQLVDFNHGKPAVTYWETVETKGCRTKVYFYPQTGRTHQLRVHSAHQLGLDTPIVGDDLYGTSEDRLMLHAESISFEHPFTGQDVFIHCLSPF